MFRVAAADIMSRLDTTLMCFKLPHRRHLLGEAASLSGEDELIIVDCG